MQNPDWLTQNMKEVIVGGGALLALGLAAYAWMKHSEQCSEDAEAKSEIAVSITQILYCAATDKKVWRYIHLGEAGEEGNDKEKGNLLASFNPVQHTTVVLLKDIRREKRWKKKHRDKSKK